jgi:hypothetical protein
MFFTSKLYFVSDFCILLKSILIKVLDRKQQMFDYQPLLTSFLKEEESNEEDEESVCIEV